LKHLLLRQIDDFYVFRYAFAFLFPACYFSLKNRDFLCQILLKFEPVVIGLAAILFFGRMKVQAAKPAGSCFKLSVK